ncbi:PREDICTED: ascorbate transporter, chloroplastic [Nicotiana attenuata]|uniref:Ascorbate transporter, chloroplastic n=1 Tax=Nicotiana attenuata TaxID=49451 RepID=A0A1J6ISU5_NICAT|nr:PREDICTED: ascorbate transporter, chloroplastic [Nicotiana attenuata]OIT07332.1 ascorbate transporter, chloroplastic [Nicotiana attenuata]
MAIGAVVSNRNFGCFVGSGREQRISRGERLGCAALQYVQRNMLYNERCLSRSGLSYSGCIYRSYSQSTGPLDGKSFGSKSPFYVEVIQPNRFSESSHVTNPRRRTRRWECYLSSADSGNSWVQPRKLDKLAFIDGQKQQKKHAAVNRTQADYKSNEYDITGALESLVSSEGASEAILVEEVEQSKPWWEQFPRRWIVVLLCFAAFLLCNMDRVNMSIAILPMSKEFNWNSATVGLIQSSFFWGYLLTQIVGGIWADKLGGKVVLGFGVVWWSIATVLTPIAARMGLPFLLVVRALMGIGEGVAMPAMNNMLSKWIPVSERSRSLALVYSGMYLGSVTGLAFSPILIQKFGWPSVFYSFGSLGSIWFALWLTKAYSSPKDDPGLSAQEKRLIMGGSVSKEPVSNIPWKLILSKAPVWALIISHFCHNWGTFILLTWMPTYYSQVLKFNLTESGLLCVLPWLTMAVFANVGGWIADTLVSKGFSITSVRKIMQSIGFLGPAFFLSQLSHVRTPALAVLCMACSQGSDAFSQSGLYSNHQDIGPRYAGVLLGLSNTAGVLAGVFGTAATGYILQKGSWDDVFKVAVILYIIGTLVWNFFSTGERILE